MNSELLLLIDFEKLSAENMWHEHDQVRELANALRMMCEFRRRDTQEQVKRLVEEFHSDHS